ncbi:hypothetical protein BDR05DRAFT_949206 [Suillus weaverae]|nr:hypothetical protein BDR05DRAFT_949206 [Suillus weaverae]
MVCWTLILAWVTLGLTLRVLLALLKWECMVLSVRLLTKVQELVWGCVMAGGSSCVNVQGAVSESVGRLKLCAQIDVVVGVSSAAGHGLGLVHVLLEGSLQSGPVETSRLHVGPLSFVVKNMSWWANGKKSACLR